MNITDYYLACNNVCKNYNIPNDISRYIFDFEIENIKKKITEEKKDKDSKFLFIKVQLINIKIQKQMFLQMLECPLKREYIRVSVHETELPNKSLNIYEIKDLIIDFIKTFDIDLKFSHFCCGKTGVMFEQDKCILY
tara:strand:- start:1636 stop:2046 length:411 start_codon:yes stop_codon:yes gene_type:complete